MYGGLPSITFMIVVPRLVFSSYDRVHVFGYTADRGDVKRFKRLQNTYFELTCRAPLIEQGITKAATLAMVEGAGLKLPRSYAMVLRPPRRDIGRCTANTFLLSSPGPLLTLVRSERVSLFLVVSMRSLTRYRPTFQQQTRSPACDFLCAIAEQGLEAARSPAAGLRQNGTQS